MKSIFEVKKAYLDKELEKKIYIKRMHKFHQILFDYSELIKTTDISKIEIVDGRVIMYARNDLRFICDPNDERIAPIEILNFNTYEDDQFKFFLTLSKNCKTFLDIGANIGWYSLSLAKSNPKLKIHSFEPIPKTYNNLLLNIELNQLRNITTHNFGLSDKGGKMFFYYYKEGSGNASLRNLSKRKKTEKISCRLKTLDSFVQKNNIKADLIKCDVEGNELNVFKGGINYIGKDKPIIFTEMLRKWSKEFEYEPNEIITLFDSIDYECFVIKRNKINKILSITSNTVETNFLFLHPKKHSLIISKYS